MVRKIFGPASMTPSRAASLLSVLLVYGACRSPEPAPAVGQPVPEIVLPDLENETVRLSDLRGRVVLLNFWATWCPPCVDEMPSLERLHRALAPQGLEVLAVSVDRSRSDIERFKEEHALTFTILHDRDARFSRAYRTFKFPETYVIDRNGRLAWKVIGPLDWIDPNVIHDLVELLKQEQV